MTYRPVERVGEDDLGDLLELFHATWWAAERGAEDARALLAHTDVALGLREEASGRLVAFARALSDRIHRAMVYDVIVHPDHRGRGLGEELVRRLLARPELARVSTVELHCRDELVPFYRRLGFTEAVAGLRVLQRRAPVPALP